MSDCELSQTGTQKAVFRLSNRWYWCWDLTPELPRMVTQHNCRVCSRRNIVSGKRLVLALLFVNFILAPARMPAALAQDSFSSGDSGDSGDQGSTGGNFNGGSGGGSSSSSVPNVVDAGYEAAARRCNTVLQQQGNFDNFPSCGEGGQGSLIEWCRHHQQQDSDCIGIVAQGGQQEPQPLQGGLETRVKIAPRTSSTTSASTPQGATAVTIGGKAGYFLNGKPYYNGFIFGIGPVTIDVSKEGGNIKTIRNNIRDSTSSRVITGTLSGTLDKNGYLQSMTLKVKNMTVPLKPSDERAVFLGY